MRFWTVMATMAGLMLAGAGSAHAAEMQWYVSPTGGDDAACTHIDPCALPAVPAKVADGDTVNVTAGTYSTGPAVTFTKSVAVRGIRGQRPVLDAAGLHLLGSGSAVSDLTLHGTADVILIVVDGTVERVDASNSSDGVATSTVCEFDGDTDVLDSACHANPLAGGPNAIALNAWHFPDPPDPTDATISLFDVTAVSPGVGVRSYAFDDTAPFTSIVGSIVSGGAKDVVAQTGAQVRVEASRMATSEGDVHAAGGVISTPLETIFSDLSQPLRPVAGSPTINAGFKDVVAQETDLDGNPRLLGPLPDMGAYEWVPTKPVVTAGQVTAISQTGAIIPASVDARGDTTSFHVDYGATDGYGASADGGSVGAGTLPKDVQVTLTGLAPGATYHYRVVASSPTGTTFGEDRTLTTLPLAVALPLPSPAPTPLPGAKTPPKVTVTLASNKKCLTSRSQSVRVKIATGGTVTGVDVYVNSKRRLRVTKSSELKRTIKVSRLPRGSYTLEVRVKTKDGRTVKSSKRFRTCSSA